MSGESAGKRVPRRTKAEVGTESHVVDELLGAPHACWARLDQGPTTEVACDSERCWRAE